MTRPRSTVLLALACGLLTPSHPGLTGAGPMLVGTITGITAPMTRQVVQRRDDNVGNILIFGTYSGDVDGFQASSTLQSGMNGQPVGWTELVDETIGEGHFLGLLRQPAGGFYDIHVRPLFRGQVGAAVTVSTVGVGEVFITAGQSNATNNGTPTGFLPSPLVSCFDEGPGYGIDPDYPGSSWRWGVDPQPAVDGSSMGSVWPTMATDLANAMGVPVGMYAVGCGGTALGQWLPGSFHFTRLTHAIEFLSGQGGVRAVLWDQGETDYLADTNPAGYQAAFQRLIDQSRAVTGVPVKWMVARATTCLVGNLAERDALEQAQASVIDYALTFPGPDTDAIGVPYRVEVGGYPLHFDAAGLVLLGGYWGIYVFNMPGFLAPGDLP